MMSSSNSHKSLISTCVSRPQSINAEGALPTPVGIGELKSSSADHTPNGKREAEDESDNIIGKKQRPDKSDAASISVRGSIVKDKSPKKQHEATTESTGSDSFHCGKLSVVAETQSKNGKLLQNNELTVKSMTTSGEREELMGGPPPAGRYK